MKKTIAIALVPLFAAAMFAQGPPRGGGFGGFGAAAAAGCWAPGRVQELSWTGEPYSATETVTSQQTLAGGNQISRTYTSTVARDSQGRISTSETVTPPASSGKAPYTEQTIFDPVSGYRYMLNSSTMIAIQEPLPPMRTGSGTPPARPTPPNETTTSLGTAVVSGFRRPLRRSRSQFPPAPLAMRSQFSRCMLPGFRQRFRFPCNQDFRSAICHDGYGVDEYCANGAERVLFVVPAGYTIQQGGTGPGPGGRNGGGPGPASRPAQWKGRPAPPPQ